MTYATGQTWLAQTRFGKWYDVVFQRFDHDGNVVFTTTKAGGWRDTHTITQAAFAVLIGGMEEADPADLAKRRARREQWQERNRRRREDQRIAWRNARSS